MYFVHQGCLVSCDIVDPEQTTHWLFRLSSTAWESKTHTERNSRSHSEPRNSSRIRIAAAALLFTPILKSSVGPSSLPLVPFSFLYLLIPLFTWVLVPWHWLSLKLLSPGPLPLTPPTLLSNPSYSSPKPQTKPPVHHYGPYQSLTLFLLYFETALFPRHLLKPEVAISIQLFLRLCLKSVWLPVLPSWFQSCLSLALLNPRVQRSAECGQ